MRKLFRPQDRLSALKLHPEYAERLGTLFEGDVQVRVIHLDGWLASYAHVPPRRSAGWCWVHPPVRGAGRIRAAGRWLAEGAPEVPHGVYALRDSVKDTRAVHDFVSALEATGIPRMLRTEVSIRPASNPPRLHGSGMILVNPPYTLEGELRILLPALA